MIIVFIIIYIAKNSDILFSNTKILTVMLDFYYFKMFACFLYLFQAYIHLKRCNYEDIKKYALKIKITIFNFIFHGLVMD